MDISDRSRIMLIQIFWHQEFQNLTDKVTFLLKCVHSTNLFSAVLKQDGHTVELVKINDRNAVELYVNGELIFSCDINDLDYGEL